MKIKVRMPGAEHAYRRGKKASEILVTPPDPHPGDGYLKPRLPDFWLILGGHTHLGLYSDQLCPQFGKDPHSEPLLGYLWGTDWIRKGCQAGGTCLPSLSALRFPEPALPPAPNAPYSYRPQNHSGHLESPAPLGMWVREVLAGRGFGLGLPELTFRDLTASHRVGAARAVDEFHCLWRPAWLLSCGDQGCLGHAHSRFQPSAGATRHCQLKQYDGDTDILHDVPTTDIQAESAGVFSVMDPEQSVKGTKKAEGSPRKRLTKGEAIQTSVPSSAPYPGSSTAATQGGPLPELLAPQPFPGPSSVLREGSQEKTGQPQKPPKRSSIEASVHISQLPQHPLTPAFMSPGKPEHLLEGSTWQLVDPMRPGPSGSFVTPGIHPQSQLLPSHASIIPTEDLPGIPKVFVPRPSQVSLKPTEEAPKKERKPQKPGKYICQYCSRPCAKPSVLQKHIRSHTGERPYPCGPCGFSFKTKSNLYKHRKSHAHRIKAGLASGMGGEMYPPGLEMERIPGEEFEEPTEGESTDSEEETGTTSAHPAELSPRPKHPLLSSSLYSSGSQGSSHERCSLSQSSSAPSLEDPAPFAEPSSEHPLSHKPEDTHTIKQKLALRLSERKKVIDEQAFLSPGSKGSTESGYFSRSESAEQQVSPPNTNARSYAEIIFGKCGRIGQRTTMLTATSTQPLLPLSTEDKPSLVPLSVPRTQVIEHITKLITINEAVVDTSEIDSVKPRRSSLSRRSSMESPKSSLYREPLSSSHSEKTKPEQSLLSLQHPPSTTPPVPLLRSHSMPSATCTLSTPHHTFRGSYSFDDHVADSEALSRSSQLFTSHPRMLKRQPAIELPLGGEYSSEEAGPSSKDAASKPTDEPEPRESDLTKKTKKGLKTKGVIYECNICGARYKKRDNYEAHKKYYCSELQMAKPVSAGAHTSPEAEKSQAEHEPWSQMMHYKLGTTLELTPLRKRRKEKSLGDEEEPPAFESTKSQFGSPGPSEAARNLPLESTKSPAEPSKSVPSLEGSAGFQPRTPKPGSGSESGKERRTTSKEISVIQHTSSFEKSDSLEQPSGLEGEDKSAAPFSSPPPAPHGRSAHSLQPRLVRQPNIQVPEILVTEEPDRPDTEPEPPPKEPEKTEEFQWPQRSQTLAQLPAEKLPPKKKRLRLAEMAQSSGESSFESSVPLSRSPSQESSVSLSGSSRSASFERDDHGKAEAAGPSSDTRSKPLGTHMLTVPSHHPHAREMRRSASEQSPNVSHATHMTETRSKSFDYGSFPSSPSGPSRPGPPAAPQREENAFCRPPETELEAAPKGRQESEEPKPSSSKSSAKSALPPMSSAATSHSGHPGGKSQVPDRPTLEATPPYTEALQVFPHPVAQHPLHEKPYLPPPVSLFSFQHLLQPEPGQSSEFFSTQAMSSLLSAPYSMPPLPPSLFQAPPLPLQPTVLHPGQLHLPQLMPHPANIPFRQPPSFLPMPYPASSALSSGFFLPLQSQFALQLPGNVEGHVPQIKTSLAPLATGTPGLPPSTEYSSDIQLPPVAPPASCSAPTSAAPLALPACPDTMVSLVVPVRIQTNMPSFGSAMYTTLSQILVTQSQGSSATVALPKFEEPSCKGTSVCGADVYEVGPRPAGVSEEQGRGFPTPYLRVPVTLPERKGTSLSSESVLSLEGSSSTVGGSKRVLSPAGSLELTMETQQQKRVKEEEASKADEKLELVKPCSVVLTTTEDGKRPEKSHLGSQGQGRRELETLSSLSSDPSDPKEMSPLPHPSSPHVTALGPEALKECAQPSGKPHRRGLLPLSVKKEDSKEQADLPPLAPPSSLPLSETPPRPAKSQEGTDSKKVLQFPSLHTTTNQKVSKETYTMATAPHPETGRLVPSSSRKPRMTEVIIHPGEAQHAVSYMVLELRFSDSQTATFLPLIGADVVAGMGTAILRFPASLLPIQGSAHPLLSLANLGDMFSPSQLSPPRSAALEESGLPEMHTPGACPSVGSTTSLCPALGASRGAGPSLRSPADVMETKMRTCPQKPPDEYERKSKLRSQRPVRVPVLTLTLRVALNKRFTSLGIGAPPSVNEDKVSHDECQCAMPSKPSFHDIGLTSHDFVIPAVGQVHLPSLVSPEAQKEIARVEKEEEKRGKPEEDAPASKRGEPARIKIFEGGARACLRACGVYCPCSEGCPGLPAVPSRRCYLYGTCKPILFKNAIPWWRGRVLGVCWGPEPSGTTMAGLVSHGGTLDLPTGLFAGLIAHCSCIHRPLRLPRFRPALWMCYVSCVPCDHMCDPWDVGVCKQVQWCLSQGPVSLSSYPVLRVNITEESLPTQEDGPQEPQPTGNVTGAYDPLAPAGGRSLCRAGRADAAKLPKATSGHPQVALTNRGGIWKWNLGVWGVTLTGRGSEMASCSVRDTAPWGRNTLP
ncbi:Transcription factor HIVEP3 [Camelus dromedarius]|uniref:Transcription factor HIVEP3 n=1 Tax=Camelus dromedarius TaxID=9838 RepID=A0A5N4DA43_CAMDR|nr:Transcription factor HIVEP3 [Camelus dromedarius]